MAFSMLQPSQGQVYPSLNRIAENTLITLLYYPKNINLL